MSGPRPKFLLLHGFLSSKNAWGPLRRELSEFETLAPDIPGYGQATRGGDDCSLEGVVNALLPVLRRERPTHIVGHSMGGIIALALAHEAPDVEGVGVIGLPVFRDRADGTAFLRSRGVIYRNFLRGDRVAHFACRGLHRTTRAWLPLAPLILPRQPREVLRSTFDHGPAGHGPSLDHIVFAGRVEDLASSVERPVFALHGSRDRTAPLDRARELAAKEGWDFRLARNVGHQLPIERPHLAARWIREYILGGREGSARSAAG